MPIAGSSGLRAQSQGLFVQLKVIEPNTWRSTQKARMAVFAFYVEITRFQTQILRHMFEHSTIFSVLFYCGSGSSKYARSTWFAIII